MEKIQQMIKCDPIIEVKIKLSNDKKFIIHQTIMTDIKPVSYYDKVLNSKNETQTVQQQENIQ